MFIQLLALAGMRFENRRRLKRVVDAGERRNTLTAVADIDVSNHKGPRDAAEPQTVDMVELIQGKGAGTPKYSADIDEGSYFHVDRGRDGIHGQHFSAQLDTG